MTKRISTPGVVLSLLYFGYLLSFADRMIFSLVVNPIKATLHLSDTQMGLLGGAAFALSFAVFSPLMGLLIDRRPRKNVLAGAVALWSLATLGTAAAASFLTMFLSRALVGVGESAIQPLAVSLISDTAPVEKRPRAFSIYNSAGAVGGILALVLGGLIIHSLTKHGGLILPGVGRLEPWRGLFVLAGAIGFILVIAILLILREPPRNPVLAADGAHPTAISWIRRYPAISVAIFLGISFSQMGALAGSTWGVTFFERVYHWPAAKAAVSLGLTGGVATLIGCLCCGPIITWLRSRGWVSAPLILALIATAFHTLAPILALSARSPIVALALFPLGSFWSYAPSVGALTALGEATPAPVRGRLAGFHTLCAGLISTSLGPLLVGVFSDKIFHQTDGIRWAMMATSVIAGVLGFLLITPALKAYRLRLTEAGAN